MQRRDRSWIIVFILVFLLGALVVVSPLLIPTGAARSFSSDNPGKSGVKAVRDLLEERGMRVQKWERGWDALPSEPGHVLFIIEPDSEGIGHQAFSDLRSWVEGGNTAVIWSRFTPPFSKSWGLRHIRKPPVPKRLPFMKAPNGGCAIFADWSCPETAGSTPMKRSRQC